MPSIHNGDWFIKIKTLIFGNGGFIGNAVFSEITKHSSECFGVKRGPFQANINERQIQCTYSIHEISQILMMVNPKNIIISLGVSSINQAEQDPTSIRNVSQVVNNILTAVSITTPESRVFFLSSAAVCGDSEDIGIVEDIQTSAISIYGLHKVSLETLVNRFTVENQLNMCVIRIFSVFGLKQLKHVIWETYSQLMNNKSVKLYGKGTEKRDFILIDDLAKQITSLLEISAPLPNIVNLGSGGPIKIMDLAVRICEILDFEADVKFTGVRNKSDPQFLYPDLTLANSLGIPRGNSLDIGLKQTLLGWHEK